MKHLILSAISLLGVSSTTVGSPAQVYGPGPSWPVPNGTGTPSEGLMPVRYPELLPLDGHVSIYLGTGEVLVHGDDVTLPGKGRDLVLTRVYRSQISYGGPFGWNTSHNLDQKVELVGADLEHLDGARLEVDVYAPVGGGLYECQTPGVYRKARLDGSAWEIRDRDGSIRRFRPLDGSMQSGRLELDVDRFGNSHTLSYDAAGRLSVISDTLGRPLTFGYDGNGHIQTLTDFAGRVTTYGYLGDDLHTVTFPPITGTPVGPGGTNNDFPAGKTQQLTYQASTDPTLAHNLETLTNPREVASAGAPIVSIAYLVDRVASVTLGSGTFQLTYATPGASGEAAQTTLVDRKGYTTEMGFDGNGGLLRYEEFTQGVHPNDPPSFATTYTLNAHGERTQELRPAGDKLVCTFDSGNADHFQRGNELTRRHVPAPGVPGGAKAMRWNNNYEPIYNQHLGSTQNQTTVIDYQEGLSASTGLANLVAAWGIQVGSFPLDLNVDKNGDGTQGQIGGQVVWEESPNITKGQPTAQKIIIVSTYDAQGRVLTRSSGEGALTVFKYASDTDGALLEARIDDADPLLSPPSAGSAFWTKSVPHVHAVTGYLRDAVGNLVEVVDPRGVRTTYVVNAHNEVLLMTRAAGLAAGADATLASMQSQGWTDLAAPAYQTYYRYDENGNLVQVDEENRGSGVPTNPWLTTVSYFDIENRLWLQSEEIGPLQSAITGFGYDANGNQDGTLHPEGNIDLSVYDERDLLFTHTFGSSDPAVAATSTYTYDANARLIAVEGPDDLDGDGLHEKTLFTYDGRGRRFQIVSPVGTLTRQLYDGADRDAGHEVWGQPEGPSPTANDTSGNVMLRRIDKLRDEIGREYEVKELVFVPAGQSGSLPYTPSPTTVTRRSQWDRDHLAVVTIDQNGDTTSSTYDGLGRLLTALDGQGNLAAHTHDAAGNDWLQVTTDVNPLVPSTPEVKTQTSVFDALGRLVRTSDTLGQTTYNAYDSRGHRVAQADAQGPLGADPLGLVAGSINLAGNTRRWIFDGLGRPVRIYADSFTGGGGVGTDLFAPGFDPSVAPVGSTGDLTSAFVYDRNGNLDKLQTDTGRLLDFDYDDLDRVVKKSFPDRSYFVTTYWNDGSVKSHALHDAAGNLFREIQMDYDGASRLVSETVVLPGGTAIEGSLLRTYQYNGRGEVTASSDDNGPWLDSAVSRMLDSSGMPLQETQNGKVISRRLDASGNRTALWYPNGRQVDYLYNTNYLLSSITEVGVPIAQYEYFGRERLAEVALGNGLTRGFDDPRPASGDITGYDAAGFPVHVEHRTSAGSNLTELTHDVDRNQNRTAEHQQVGGGAARSDLMAYDSQQRLQRFQRNVVGANPAELDQTYHLDGDSNWLDLVIQAAGQLANTYTVATGVTWKYTSIGGSAITADLAGNRTGDAWFHYRYDAFDRLVRVAQKLPGGGEGPTLLTFAYDAEGRRIEKVSLYATTRYFYEGLHLIEERSPGEQVLAQHVLGNGIDEVVQSLRDADAVPGLEAYYPLADTLGSPIALTDAAGLVVERYDYDAYGAPRFLDGAGNPLPGAVASDYGNAFLFTGREYDWELADFKLGLAPFGYFSEWSLPVGQYFYRARYMDPSEGRFVGRDPLAVANNGAGDPLPLLFARLTQGFVESPYTQVEANPQNATDPLGLAASTVVIDGHLYTQLGCIPTNKPKPPAAPPRQTPAPAPRPVPRAPTPSGGGIGGKLWGGVKFAGKWLGVTNAAASLWAGTLTGIFNPGEELLDAAGFCLSLWTGGLQAMTGMPECPGADDVIVLPGAPPSPGRGSGGPGGPSTPGPGGPGAPGPSPPGTCRTRVLHMCSKGSPGDCWKPSSPTTPGPSGPQAPGAGPKAPPPGSYPASSTRMRPCTPGGAPSGPGGGGTPTSVHPKPCTPLPESTMKGPDGKYYFVLSCADAIAAGYTCKGSEEQYGGQQQEIDDQQVRADGPRSRFQLATFMAERESEGSRVVWSPPRGTAGHFTLVRVDAQSGAEEVLVSRAPFSGDRVFSHRDAVARDTSRYVLVVHDANDDEWSFGPVTAKSSVAVAAREAMDAGGTVAAATPAPARRRLPIGLLLALGLLGFGVTRRTTAG